MQNPTLEADDLIAGWIKLHPDYNHVIVSSDSDFYQLLDKNVTQYNGITNQHIKVDGVYDKDPALNSDAKKFKKLNYSDVISKDLRIMDLTAITLCKENNLPVQVFDINKYGNLRKLVLGKDIGTIIN